MSEHSDEPRARDMFKGRRTNALMTPRNDASDERQFRKMLAAWNAPVVQPPKLNIVIKPSKDAGGGSQKA